MNDVMSDAVIKPDPTTLVMKRRIEASPAEVYAAWVTPEILAKWFVGTHGIKCTVHAADVRAGGRYDFEIEMGDGEIHRVGGIYQEIVENKKLVFTWAWVSTPERESLVTIDLRSDGSIATMLTLTHQRFFDEHARDMHAGGWTGCLDALAGHFA